MANEPTRRVAQLPGFDTAPDVYETPDIDDSTTTNSTLQTSTRDASSASETSDEDDEDDGNDESFGVSRRRLYPERARSRFGAQAKGVETKGTDLSDRVDGKRRGWKIRRGRGGDEEEEESLEARIARLRREVEECRSLAQEQQNQNEDGDGDGDENVEGNVGQEADALSKMLAGMDVPSTATTKRTRVLSGDGLIFHDALPTAPGDESTSKTPVDEHTLSRIAAFDSRLAALETTLGLSSVLDLSSTDPDIISTPVLPSLTLLDQQLSTLTSASSLASLEAASSRIAKLKLEAQNLSNLHTAAVTSEVNSEAEDEDAESSTASGAPLTPDDLKRLENLYTLLPNLQSLAPTIPMLITRLRSLRTLHTAAATAADDLDAIEQRQAEMDGELKMWREGLERVERAVKDADAANGKNGRFVRSWVDDLEARVKGLGR